MEQIFKPAEVLTLDRPEEAIQRFEELKNTEIKKADEFTIVRMHLIIGCGCGGNSANIFGVIKGNDRNIVNRFSGDYVDNNDLRDMKRRYPEMSFYKGTPKQGVTDHFNPDLYEKIL